MQAMTYGHAGLVDQVLWGRIPSAMQCFRQGRKVGAQENPHFFLDLLLRVLYSICPFVVVVGRMHRNFSAWEVL